MFLIPWDNIQASYESNGGKGVQDHVENWLTHSVESNQQKIEIVQEALQPDDIPISLNIRILCIKSILGASNDAIRSGSVFGSVGLRSSTLTWLCDIAQNTGEQSHSASLRGGVLAVFTLLLKRFPKETSKFVGIGESLCFCLRDAASGLSDPDLTPTTLISNPCSMLLSKIVEVLTMAGDASLPWLQPVGGCVESVALILQHFSALQLDKDNSLTATLNQLQIKVCKAFSMVVEISASAALPRASSGTSAVAESPSNVLKLVSSTSIVHDIFQSTYQSALDVSNSSCQWSIQRAATLVGSICAAVADQNQSQSVPDEGSEGTRVVVTYPYPSVIEIRRVESLLGLLCCVLDCHQDSVKSPQCSTEDESISLALADSVMVLVKEIMCCLKTSLSREAISCSTCGSSSKDLRTASSDARKGCIAVAHSLLCALPSWVAADLRSCKTVASSETWVLAVKQLSTPLLFGAAYAASALSAREDKEDQYQHQQHELFTEHVLQYLSAALRSVSKYSYAVACDVLTALEELLDKNCTAVLQFQADIPLLLLQAYLSSPKGIAPATGAKMKKATSSSDEGNAYEWKLHVMSTIKAVFQCATRLQTSNGFSEVFVSRFINDVCCSEMFILHGALGNLLPGHVSFFSSLLEAVNRDGDCDNGDVVTESREAVLAEWHSTCTTSTAFTTLTPASGDSMSKSTSRKERCRKDCNRVVTSMLGSSEMSEPLVGLLHTATLSLVAFLDVVNMTLRQGQGGMKLQETSHRGLLVLLCFLADISQRPLLFEDDGAQLCGELEVVSRFLEMTFLSGSSGASGHDRLLAGHFLGVLMRTCFRTLRSSFQLGSSFGKIIYEISYTELLRAIACVTTPGAGAERDVEEVSFLAAELAPTYELAIRQKQEAHGFKVGEEEAERLAADVVRTITERVGGAIV